jgi:hypothetical protein
MSSTQGKKKGPALTAERLRELLDYDPETGIFTSRPRPLGRLNKGYRHIQIEGRDYSAHRLAWFYVYGEWPPGQLDHKDTHRDHNWIDNLRPATTSQNLANRRRYRNNASGLKGVSWHKSRKKWRAVIAKNGKYIHLGLFDTAETAHAAYLKKARELFGEYANGG